MGSLTLIVIPVAWALALGLILYYRFRDVDDLNPPSSERRRSDRRADGKPHQASRSTDVTEVADQEQRELSDRRQNEAWREEYNTLKSKVENDGTA